MKKTLTTLLGALSLSMSAASNAGPLPIDIFDTADVNYSAYVTNCGGGMSCITDASSLGTGGGGDHYDDAFGISVNGVGYAATSATINAPRNATFNDVTFGNFVVSVNMFSSGPVMRQIVSVTNVGTSADDVDVRWHNNTGNDSGQRVVGTSDGDLVGEATDRWIVTADNDSGPDNEVNAWILFGPGVPALTPSSVSMTDASGGFGCCGEQGLSALFDFGMTIGAGETSSLMFFAGMEGYNHEGIALANNFNSTDSVFFQDLIADLTSDQLNSIVNWDLSASVPVPPTAYLFIAGLAMLLRRTSLRKAAK